MERKKKVIRYVLTEYIELALETATYDKLADSTFAGKIEQCPGVVSFGTTLLECQSELRSTLEEWVLLGLRLRHKLPSIAGIDLNKTNGRSERHPVSYRGKRKKSTGVW